jgi:hypothetical protein
MARHLIQKLPDARKNTSFVGLGKQLPSFASDGLPARRDSPFPHGETILNPL